MAKVKLILDTRDKSRSPITGLFPVALRVFHKQARMIRLSYYTSAVGWDKVEGRLKKAAKANKNQNCERINIKINRQWQIAKNLIDDLGNHIRKFTVDELVEKIKTKWDEAVEIKSNDYSFHGLNGIAKTESNDHSSEGLNERTRNDYSKTQITLEQWGKILIERKEKAKKTGTAECYRNSIDAFKKFNNDKDLRLSEITVSFLNEFQAEHEARGNKPNTISNYIRGISAIYNAAITEDKFSTPKNPFDFYELPKSRRTVKRAQKKEKIVEIRKKEYEYESVLWHAKNYLLIMFNCRGMNFIDLVKMKVDHIRDGRVYYGRSKTGEPLSIKITSELEKILDYYLKRKKPGDFVFPVNYDGSPEHYEKYKSQRRRFNERLKIIAKDVGIEGKFTSYSIRHSWATIAKFIGVPTEVISEGLGHHSLNTTEIYLKSFENEVLDEANEKVVS